MEDIEWNVVHEGYLLDAMVGHKPVGVNKYFQMACICQKICDTLNKDVHPDKIWDHLKTMYNLDALDENESIPFPNSEKEFILPEEDFGAIMIKREEEEEEKRSTKGRETPKLKKEDSKSNNRRDSKDSNKEVKVATNNSKSGGAKETNNTKSNSKTPVAKGRQTAAGKEESRGRNSTPTPVNKRPTRGSLKPDDSSSSGKSSPINTPTSAKRRRT